LALEAMVIVVFDTEDMTGFERMDGDERPSMNRAISLVLLYNVRWALCSPATRKRQKHENRKLRVPHET
jgi:hypothetical protein